MSKRKSPFSKTRLDNEAKNNKNMRANWSYNDVETMCLEHKKSN